MKQEHKASEFFIIMAAIVIVMAGVKSAAVIIEPILLSLFMTIIFAPFFSWLNKRGLPSGLSLLIVVAFIVFIIGLVGVLIGSSVHDFSNNLPYYEKQLQEQFRSLVFILNGYGIEVPKEEISAIFDTHKMMKVAAGGLKSLGSVLTNSLVIILTVVFMLLESMDIAQKIEKADGKKETLVHLGDVVEKIKKYMVLKTFVSLFTASLVWVLLTLFQIDFAILWAFFAFLLNYIPNIGSLIAAVPAVLLAIVQFGFMSAIEIAIGYVVINVVIGSILEPKIMGSGLGLSTLVVFLSLIFWGWLLGPVGMLLSIPLTIMAKIVFDAKPNTRWIAIMLGTGVK